MININNKSWDKLDIEDIKILLAGADDETFFFEFKSDEVKTDKLIEEISAFANTYGGYILLGIDDSKSIVGCTKWSEERIHTTIHDCLSPTPQFDIKKLISDDKVILVIKIEEGSLPPYITNKGKIFERVSSGSYVVKTSDKLSQIYHKHEEELKRIDRKLAITEIKKESDTPRNLFGCVDMGFSLTISNLADFQKKLYSFDFTEVAKVIKKITDDFSISKVGHSYIISIGNSKYNLDGKDVPSRAGCHHFMEIMADGSVKCRVVLISDIDTSNVNINYLALFMSMYKKIYMTIFGEAFADNFISALKYEKLTVLNQFTPYYDLDEDVDTDGLYKHYLESHKSKYGNNLIIDGNRIPKNGFSVIDKRHFDEIGVDFNNDELLYELFSIGHFNLGYIDFPKRTKL